MKSIRIDPEKCNRDGICVQVCPGGLIQPASGDTVPIAAADFETYCLACGHCVSVCPTGALSLDWLGPDDCVQIDKELFLSPSQAEQFLRSRRSIRKYKNQPVEKERLEQLLRIACCAPSAKNNQPWHWTVVERQEDVRAMAALVIEWMQAVIAEQPRLAAQHSFPRVVAAWEAGEERICRGAPHLIVVHADSDYPKGAEDCALALSYLELLAPVLGLGACWGGYFYSAVNAYAPLRAALDLPSEHRAFGAMMVGYPKYRYRRLPEREAPRVNWL